MNESVTPVRSVGSEVPDGLAVTRDHVLDELRRADAKATTLLSLVGAAFAGVIALTGRHLPLIAGIVLTSAALPLLAGVLVLLAVIRPRLNNHPVPGSWLYAARNGPTQLLQACTTNAFPTTTATEVCVLARIAARKYRRIRCAVTLLVAGLAMLVAALLLAGVTT